MAHSIAGGSVSSQRKIRFFLATAMENGTFDQPSAVTWHFFTDIAMERAPTDEQKKRAAQKKAGFSMVLPFKKAQLSKNAVFKNRKLAISICGTR